MKQSRANDIAVSREKVGQRQTTPFKNPLRYTAAGGFAFGAPIRTHLRRAPTHVYLDACDAISTTRVRPPVRNAGQAALLPLNQYLARRKALPSCSAFSFSADRGQNALELGGGRLGVLRESLRQTDRHVGLPSGDLDDLMVRGDRLSG